MTVVHWRYEQLNLVTVYCRKVWETFPQELEQYNQSNNYVTIYNRSKEMNVGRIVFRT